MTRIRCNNRTGWAILLTTLNTIALALILAAMTSWANARAGEDESRTVAMATGGQINVARLLVQQPGAPVVKVGQKEPEQAQIAPPRDVSQALDKQLEQQMQQVLDQLEN